MTQKSIIKDIAAASANRRHFMRNVGLASVALGAVSATDGLAQSSPPGDANILNFALNLEYLEAEFYAYATTGAGISTAGVTITGSGNGGPTTGGGKVTFTDAAVQAVALELASNESAHVTLLQGAIASLGATAVAKPAINLNALGFGFNNMNAFLILARIFEDIGVTAYGAAAPLIQSSTVLGYAARILAVEALHSGNIRAQIARLAIGTSPALDGADHLPPPSGSQYFTTDQQALTELRSPGQVLFLAYGGVANAISGGFFPNGVNGVLNTSSSASANSDGATLSASPNPIHVPAGQVTGSTTISWSAPAAQVIEIRVGSPTGGLFTHNLNSGSMTTQNWVTDGVTLYLQDVTNGKALTSANTAATLVLHLATP